MLCIISLYFSLHLLTFLLLYVILLLYSLFSKYMANWGKILSRGNVEDRRSLAPMAMGGLSLTGVALLFLFNFLSGGDVGDVLGQLQELPLEQIQDGGDKKQFEGLDTYEEFASIVLGSTDDMWSEKFWEMNRTYTPPKLVLFRNATQSACGVATSDVGPHYCPLDKTIYLDETFFDELESRFGAQGGDVAEAYVIAHEAAHHAQNELGIFDEKYGGGRDNETSVKMELQADCFAGLWAHSVKDMQVFEEGEIGEAMDAAAAVGDDRIQKRSAGYVNPETWTHGSSEDRVRWFTTGYTSGDVNACNTFR